MPGSPDDVEQSQWRSNWAATTVASDLYQSSEEEHEARTVVVGAGNIVLTKHLSLEKASLESIVTTETSPTTPTSTTTEEDFHCSPPNTGGSLYPKQDRYYYHPNNNNNYNLSSLLSSSSSSSSPKGGVTTITAAPPRPSTPPPPPPPPPPSSSPPLIKVPFTGLAGSQRGSNNQIGRLYHRGITGTGPYYGYSTFSSSSYEPSPGPFPAAPPSSSPSPGREGLVEA